MKKVISFLCFIIAIPAFGENVCVKTGTYITVLQKGVDGVSSTHDTANKTWSIDFGYRTITGESACNTISGTYGTPKTNLYTGASDEGTYCWCRMWPVGSETGITSHWTFYNTYADASTCASNCTSDCKSAISANTNSFRTYIFEAIW